MPQIKIISADHFQIPLPVILTDATHGEMSEFDIITVRIRDADGDEGLGYTYCVDRGAADAIKSLVSQKYEFDFVVTNTSETSLKKIFFNKNYKSLFFNGNHYDPDILNEISNSNNILISIPPISGEDIVLKKFFDISKQ